MTSKQQAVQFVCNYVIPSGTVLATLLFIIIPTIILHTTTNNSQQSELTVGNNKDICTLINNLDNNNLTCTDLLQTQQFSNILQMNVILALECTDTLVSILCQCRDHPNLPSNDNLDLERICSPVDIVQCADGFYETNGSCLPSCSTFREVDDSTAKSVLILYCLGFGFSAIFCTIYFIVILIKKKKVLKFPSLLLTISLLGYVPYVLCSLISLIGGKKLFCSTDDLVQSIEHPSWYCIFSGVLSSFANLTALFFLMMVVVLFWKLQFPVHAHAYRHYETRVLTCIIIISLFIPLLYIILALSSTKYSFVPVLYPTTRCTSRDIYLNFYFFNLLVLLSMGISVSLLIVKLTQFQKTYGFCFWKSENIVNTAEKKLLFLALLTSIVLMLTGITHNVRLINTFKLEEALSAYFICELFGSQVNSCNKEQLEKYSIPVVGAVAETVAVVLLPLVYTLTIVEWTSTISWIKSKIMKSVQLLYHKTNSEL